MIPAFRKNAGFSIIELAIFLCIVSLLAAAGMSEYDAFLREKISGNNESRKNLISNALTQFLTNYGRLPCPADPSLGPGASGAGYEVCFWDTTKVPATDPLYLGTSNPTLGCKGQVCRVAGRRDTPADTNTNADPVLLGSVPYATLGISVLDATDAYGNKMDYAVTEFLTNLNPQKIAGCTTCVYNDAYGAIEVKELVMDPTTHTELGIFTKGGLANFNLMLLSHGPDGKGAYDYSGRLVSACVGTARDVENCDGNAIFLNADRSTGIYNPQAGSKFFDDAFTLYKIRRDSDKWDSTSGGMQNKTSGKVGINNTSPGTTLDVGGNIKLNPHPTDPAIKGESWASDYCSDASGYCFKPTMISGTINDSNPAISSAHCGTAASPELMQGINGSATWKMDCVSTVSTLTITPSSCPAGQYMKGIDALGGIVCVAP